MVLPAAFSGLLASSEHYRNGEYITVISIAEKLGISKIYLEQSFSLLKRGGIVTSTKGSQVGYQLARTPREITLLDVMSAVELSLFEPTEETVSEKAPEVEEAMRLVAFDKMQVAIQNATEKVTLNELETEVQKHKQGNGYMYYI